MLLPLLLAQSKRTLVAQKRNQQILVVLQRKRPQIHVVHLIPAPLKSASPQIKLDQMLTQSNLYKAAQTLAEIQLRYAQSGRSLSDAALCGAKEFIEWQHYPNNDLVDEASGYEFYYHSHSSDEMPKGEHGHFHVIKRAGESFHHLIGIALDRQGLPVRL